MKVNSKDVPKQWIKGLKAIGYGSIHTDGVNIYSYEQIIGVIYDCYYVCSKSDSPSVTTSKHIGYVIQELNNNNIEFTIVDLKTLKEISHNCRTQ